MTHQEFAEQCRSYYSRHIYTDAALKNLVKKGALTQEEYDCIINKTPLPWEQPTRNAESE